MARGEEPLLPRRSGHIGLSVTATALLAVATAIPLTTPAAALEIFGYRIFGEDEAEPEIGPDAKPYALDLDVLAEDEDIEDLVRRASRLWREREDPPPPSTAALLNRVRAEYARIVGALYTAGRYGPVVEITVAGRDPFEIAPDADLPTPVPIEVTVDPGPAFTFGEVAITGRAPPPVEEDDVVEPSDDAAALQSGELARSTAVLATERLLVEEWREQGHPKAAISERDAVANHPTETLAVRIDVNRGPFAVFGPVAVTGTERMNPEFVRYMTGIEPGQPFDPDTISRAQRNLRQLGVFSTSRLVEAEEVGADGALPMTVAVAERPLHAAGVGATWSSVDGAGVETYWEHRNLFGQAEQLRLDARVGGIDSVNAEDFNYFVGASFLKPGVFTPYTDLTALVSGERNVLDTYTDNTVRARVGLAHEAFDGLTLAASINVEAVKIEDSPRAGEFLLVSLPAEIDWDRRDDELDPTTGYRVGFGLEPFYEFQYGNTGVIAELEGSVYFPIDDEGDFVIAARAAVGSLVGAEAGEIPESRLFFVGGGGSVRGYAYRGVGPIENGEVVGGLSYVEASLELRAMVTDTIGIVPFVDAGSAYSSSLPDFSEDIKIGAGVGLRYYTGIGPIRADVAFPLDPGPDDPSFGVYIGLGQAF